MMIMMQQQQQQQRQQQQQQPISYQQSLAAPSEPRPIPLNGDGNRRPSSNRLHSATSSSELLSKSLGDMPNLTTELLRCSSAVSGIKHRGYLLKRSNHPYRASDEEKLDRCLFPSSEDGKNQYDERSHYDMANRNSISTAVLHPKQNQWSIDDEPHHHHLQQQEQQYITSNWILPNSTGPSYQQPSEFDVIMPHKPQHVMNQEQEEVQLLLPPLPNLWQNGVNNSSTALRVMNSSDPLDELAAFFGMRNGVARQYQEQLHEPAVLIPTDLTDPESLNAKLQTLLQPPPAVSHSILIAPQVKRSLPISFARSSVVATYPYDDDDHVNDDADDGQHDHINNSNSNDSSDYNSHNRRMSAPCSSGSSGDLPPSDVVDPNDGHLWRSKYCVLEDGVLYFYRNKYEGECPEARLERNNSRTVFDDGYDLSKSPMPRHSRLLAMTSQDNHHQSTNHNNQFLWEKRVALEKVGAVRSAELEFGPNSFELLANENDDDEDDEDMGNRRCCHDDDEDNNDNKLILRAASQKEMQEWLFQFHRSVATYFMKLVQGISSSHQNNFMDLHHPSFQQPMMMSTAAPVSPSQHDSPLLQPGSLALSAFSPRLRMPLAPISMAAPMSTSLSHGHGRMTMRRRRVDDGPKPAADSKSRNHREVSPGESTPELETTQVLPFSMTPSEEPVFVPQSVFQARLLPALPSPTESSPEISAPVSICPETERPRPSTTGKYIPPHLRNQQQQQNGTNTSTNGNKYVPPSVRRRQQQQQQLAEKEGKILSLQERATMTPLQPQSIFQDDMVSEMSSDAQHAPWEQSPAATLSVGVPLKLGGCADPLIAVGSILDSMYTSKNASKIGKVYTEPFGCRSGDAVASSSKSNPKAGVLQWEIGAVSECGVRESNEDSYVIAADLHLMLESLRDDSSSSSTSDAMEPGSDKKSSHNSLFAVFDGHCGNQAARFAAEKLPTFIRDQYSVDGVFVGSFGEPSRMEDALMRAIVRLDQDFCRLCIEEGRDWESGSTALVAMLANDNLVIANLGDCRGVVGRCVDDSDDMVKSRLERDGWEKLNIHGKANDSDDEDEDSKWTRAMGAEVVEDGEDEVSKKPATKTCYWRLVTDVHSPAKVKERARIEGANGWITTESEIPIGQLQRMDFLDADVIEILKRCLSDSNSRPSKAAPQAAPQRILQITRVCGELAVSRAIGDRDFKAAYNQKSDSATVQGNDGWGCLLDLKYPDEHNRTFVGDLVSGIPDFDTIRVGEPGVSDEFLLLACDGLWDVLDPDDAVNITRGLLFNMKFSAKRAAARLAELAIHLGSSDNITVIVVRFFRSEPTH